MEEGIALGKTLHRATAHVRRHHSSERFETVSKKENWGALRSYVRARETVSTWRLHHVTTKINIRETCGQIRVGVLKVCVG